MEASNYTKDDFLRDMAPFNLSYRDPRTITNLWVFWSQEGEGNDMGSVTNNNWRNVKEYLKSALCNAEYKDRANVLIQFWAPTSSTIGRRCVFTTSNQPFSVYRIERGVCEYRKYCATLEFNVFQDEDKFSSLIGRVFRRKVQASAEEGHTEKDHLLRDFARKCGIRRSVFLPLFKPFSQCCSGVLEIVHTSKRNIVFHFKVNSRLLCQNISKSALPLQEANLKKPSPLELLESTEIEEINKALHVVRTTHQLPLAQIWIPCCTSTAMAYVDSPSEHCHSPYLSCSNKFSSSISWNGDAYFHCTIKDFNLWCRLYIIGKGQGIVGKALLYDKPCFCRDVTLLPIAEYPLSNVARVYNLTGCYAIWLHSTGTKNHDYVLEFFLPPCNTISGDPKTHLEMLLATVKKQFPGFKIGSVGEESCVEVSEIPVNYDEAYSAMISQTASVQPVPKSFANERKTVQNEVVCETDVDIGSNILGLEQNGIVVCQSGKTVGQELFVKAATNDELTISLPPRPESLRNENEVVQQLSDDEPTIEEAVRKNELNVAIVKQTSVAEISSERIFSIAEASEREYKTTEITLSHEDLPKHFGKKHDNATQTLAVSRSTTKSACRLHKIDKGPHPKRKKHDTPCFPSGNEGTEKGDPSCPDPPSRSATAGISHKTSNSIQEQDVRTVTIKATHGDNIIRFPLPFLSRKTDLVEKVTTRLFLNEGSFNIKYKDEAKKWISIACDEDLEKCIRIWKGKSIIKMLVEPITNQARSRSATAGISDKTSNSIQEQDVGTVTIKATHGNDTIRFQLPFLSRKTDLVEKVTMRLLLNEDSFNIKYQDEAKKWISIACDEDLEECIRIWKGKSIIKMLVEPITNQAPSKSATAGISDKASNSIQEQDVGTVTIKATHGNDTIRFQLPFLSRKMDLMEKVTMRLLLNEDSFNIKYQDEAKQWIPIACDEDLEECIRIWKGKSIIKMLVEPITNQAP
ncbi:hypothetical protein LguiB_012768 [Lonicera macranthoides]